MEGEGTERNEQRSRRRREGRRMRERRARDGNGRKGRRGKRRKTKGRDRAGRGTEGNKGERRGREKGKKEFFFFARSFHGSLCVLYLDCLASSVSYPDADLQHGRSVKHHLHARAASDSRASARISSAATHVAKMVCEKREGDGRDSRI